MALQKGVSRTITFDMLTTAGAADTTTAPTVTVSKDGGSFASTTNAASRIGATNVFSLVLTATEWTADLVTVQATGTGCVPRTLSFLTEADYTTAKSAFLNAAVSGVPGATVTAWKADPSYIQDHAYMWGKYVNNQGGTVTFYGPDGVTVVGTQTLSPAPTTFPSTRTVS